MPCTAQLARQSQPNFNPHPTYTEQDYMILLLHYYQFSKFQFQSYFQILLISQSCLNRCNSKFFSPGILLDFIWNLFVTGTTNVNWTKESCWGSIAFTSVEISSYSNTVVYLWIKYTTNTLKITSLNHCTKWC